MKLSDLQAEIEYPESDGTPMGETDLHRDWMFHLIELLRRRYRGQKVYVSGDLFVYFEEGNPKKCVAPDTFVVKDCDPGRRRIYKLWEERRTPNAIFEVTSRKTKKADLRFKPETYTRLRIPEYFLFDPTADYLVPPLQGFRLEEGGYCPIEPDASGALVCEELDLLLRLEDGDLHLYDRASGERLLTETQAARAEHERERQAREAERQAHERERQAREAAEAEVQRLRKLLEDRAGGES